jgi:hypothetical protein
MPDEIQPVKALYFPRTHFSSMRWLKTALLYWEGVLRIVPDDALMQDPPEVHELAAAGLVEHVTPEGYWTRAKRRFLGHLEGTLQLDAEGRFPCSLGRTESGQKRYKTFLIGKIERELLKELQAHGLAVAGADFVTMASETTDLYLMGLAHEIARDLHAAPSTNPPLEEVPATFLALQRAGGDPTAQALVDGYACARTMAAFRLLEASDLPVPKLLRARQKYAQERRAFREVVQQRVAAMAVLRSAHAINAQFRNLGDELENGAETERRSRSAAQWRHAWKIAGVVSPASIGGVVTLSGAPTISAAIGGVGSVAAGITDWVMEHRKVRHASDYLLSLETLAAGLRRAQQRTQLAPFQ